MSQQLALKPLVKPCFACATLLALAALLGGCGGNQQNNDANGPPITDATRQAVQSTGKVLPPPSTPVPPPQHP